MIKAEHKRWARFVFNPYINRLVRKSFSHFYLVNEPPPIPDSESLIITPNHFSWWDGFFIDYVMRRYSTRRLYIMMLEEQLKRYWFFRKLGAYSIDLNNPRSIVESIVYTVQILENPNNFVVYYPQGEIQPYDKRPLQLKQGLVKVLKSIQNSAVVLPAGFKIQHGNERMPDVFARFGNPLPGNKVADSFELLEKEFFDNIQKLDIASHEGKYDRILF